MNKGSYNQRKLFTFFLLLFSCLLLSAQSTDFEVEGFVRNAINAQPLDNAEIKVWKRICKEDKGIKHLQPFPLSEWRDVLHSDSKGHFQTQIQANVGEIWALSVASSDKITQYYTMIVITAKGKQQIDFALLPKEISEEEATQLEAITFAEKAALAQQKELISLDESHIPQNIQDYFATNPDASPESVNTTCSIAVPTEVYVSNLINGYNSTATGTGFTGMINFDEYVAGVTQKEIGGITSLAEALKTLAVAARTFSYRRHTLNQPVNVGQAYDFSPNAACIAAANATTQQVLLYNNAVITANYAARCNGNFTQNSEQGRWGAGTCGATCATCGNNVAYLRSVICSGHQNCTNFTSEQPCCELNISTVNTLGNIYGHGVGLCQRGTQQFAGTAFNWSYCDILTHYYTNICIANTSCAGGNTAFSLATIPNPINGGTILGGGIYNTNTSATLTATANPNYSFVNWTENGISLSTNPTYTTNITANRNIVANFTLTSAITPLNTEKIQVSPNPNTGSFFIKGNNPFKVAKIVNAIGTEISFRQDIQNEGIQLTLSTQVEGVYYLFITDEQGAYTHNIPILTIFP